MTPGRFKIWSLRQASVPGDGLLPCAILILFERGLFPPLTRQGLAPLISLPGYGSQKSGARSQNGDAVSVEQAAGFLQRGGQGVGVAVSKVGGEDQVIAAFLE